MTRRYTETETPKGKARVTVGYDRVLDEFFLQVELVSVEHTPELIYTSNADATASSGRKDLKRYARTLEHLGLKVPESLLTAVAEDAILHRGNWVVEHLADGTTRTILEESG